MKTEEIIGLVAVAYNRGVKSDDSRLENQLVYAKLLTIRQKLITQQIKKHQKISDWNYVILPCVEVIEVPSHNCPCLPDLTCGLYRTKYQLPKALTDLNSHLISFVMSIDNGMLIDETFREEFLYNNGNKFTSKKTKYLLENGYLYFPKKSPGVVKIKYLPENPLDVLLFPSLCPCEDCDDCIDIMDMEFPIDGDLIDTLVELTKQSLIEDFKVAIEDQSNNNKDSSQEQAK
jgi:hypothetical protein